MKRSVSKWEKFVTVLAAVTFALMLAFETGQALLMALLLGVGALLMKLHDDPPGWLRRSPLGRWLRH